MLRRLTAGVEVAKLPPEALAASLDPPAEPAPPAGPDEGAILTRLRDTGLHEARRGGAGRFLRHQARVRAALAAIACERYRTGHGNWPEGLESLVPVYIEVVPSDPYGGERLRFRRTTDGIVAYSVGPDRSDDGGNVDRTSTPPGGTDLGFRLRDVANRG